MLSVLKLTDEQPSSFEYIMADFAHSARHVRVIVLYRPPSSQKQRLLSVTLSGNFSELLDQQVIFTGNLIIVGDFNIHWDDSKSNDVNLFADLLTRYNLSQLVKSETHPAGHIIALVIVPRSDPLITSVGTSDWVSDHCAVHFKLILQKPTLERITISFRKITTIDPSDFRLDTIASPLVTSPASSSTSMVDQYNSTLEQLLDEHAPRRTCHISDRPAVPWYSEDIAVVKRKRRSLERQWRSLGLHRHREMFKAQRLFMFRRAKFNF